MTSDVWTDRRAEHSKQASTTTLELSDFHISDSPYSYKGIPEGDDGLS